MQTQVTSTARTVGEQVAARVAAVQTKPPKRFAVPVALVAIVCLYFLVRLPFVFMVPISEAPDEGAHTWVMNFIIGHHRLPGLSDLWREPADSYYGSLLPLCYAPNVLCRWVFPFFQADLAFRFGTLLMGALAVVGGYGVARLLMAQSRYIALLVPLFMVFHPQLAFVNSYSNNDTASCAVATLTLYCALLAVQKGLTSNIARALGALVGLLLLCKPTTYCLLPVVALAMVAAAWLQKTAVRTTLQRLFVCAAIALGISAPWFLRNCLLFQGDLLGMQTMLKLWWAAYGKPAPLYHWPVVNDPGWRYLLSTSYWAAFGNMNRLLANSAYRFYSLFAQIACAGAIFAALDWFFRGERKAAAVPWAMLVVAVLLNFTAVVIASASLNATGPPQGRYMFPTEAAIAALLIGGLRGLPGRVGKIAPFVFVGFVAVTCAKSIALLYPAYHFSLNVLR